MRTVFGQKGAFQAMENPRPSSRLTQQVEPFGIDGTHRIWSIGRQPQCADKGRQQQWTRHPDKRKAVPNVHRQPR